MTVYIRPNGDDENDGVKVLRSNHPSAQSQSQIGLRTTRSTCSRPIGRGSIAPSTPRKISSHRVADRKIWRCAILSNSQWLGANGGCNGNVALCTKFGSEQQQQKIFINLDNVITVEDLGDRTFVTFVNGGMETLNTAPVT